MITHTAGVQIMHVPYKSGPQVLTDVAGGTVDLAVLPVALVQGMVKDNKVRAYGVTSTQRSDALPGVPSLSETRELAKLDVESWMGLLGPAGLDPALVARLNKEVAAVLADPGVLKQLADGGMKPMQMSPAEFRRLPGARAQGPGRHRRRRADQGRVTCWRRRAAGAGRRAGDRRHQHRRRAGRAGADRAGWQSSRSARWPPPAWLLRCPAWPRCLAAAAPAAALPAAPAHRRQRAGRCRARRVHARLAAGRGGEAGGRADRARLGRLCAARARAHAAPARACRRPHWCRWARWSAACRRGRAPAGRWCCCRCWRCGACRLRRRWTRRSASSCRWRWPPPR